MATSFMNYYCGDPESSMWFQFALKRTLGDQAEFARTYAEAAAQTDDVEEAKALSALAESYGSCCALVASLLAALAQQMPPGTSFSDLNQQQVLEVSADAHRHSIKPGQDPYKGYRDSLDGHGEQQAHGVLSDPYDPDSSCSLQLDWQSVPSRAAMVLSLTALAAACATTDTCRYNMEVLLRQVQGRAAAAQEGREVNQAWVEALLAKAEELPGKVAAYSLVCSQHYRLLLVDARGGPGHWVVWIVDSWGELTRLQGSSSPGGELQDIPTDNHMVMIQLAEDPADLVNSSSSSSSSTVEGYPHPPLAQQLLHLLQHSLSPEGLIEKVTTNLQVVLAAAAPYLESVEAGEEPLAALPATLLDDITEEVTTWPTMMVSYMVPTHVMYLHGSQLPIVPVQGQQPLTATWEPPRVVDVGRFLVAGAPPMSSTVKEAQQDSDSASRDVDDIMAAAAAAAGGDVGEPVHGVVVVAARRTPTPTPRSRCASPCPAAAAAAGNPPDSPRSQGKCDQEVAPTGAVTALTGAAAKALLAANEGSHSPRGGRPSSRCRSSSRSRSRSGSPCSRPASPAGRYQVAAAGGRCSPRPLDRVSVSSSTTQYMDCLSSPRGLAPTSTTTTAAATAAAAAGPNLSRLSARGPAVLGDMDRSEEETVQQGHIMPLLLNNDKTQATAGQATVSSSPAAAATTATATATATAMPAAGLGAAASAATPGLVSGQETSNSLSKATGDPLPEDITNMLGATSGSSSKGPLLVEALARVWGRLSTKVRSALAKAAAKAAKGGSALLKALKALVKKILKGCCGKQTQE